MLLNTQALLVQNKSAMQSEKLSRAKTAATPEICSLVKAKVCFILMILTKLFLPDARASLAQAVRLSVESGSAASRLYKWDWGLFNRWIRIDWKSESISQ